jgi:predicted O-methyltransferase YrrM
MSSITRLVTGRLQRPERYDQETFRRTFEENLAACDWRPHPKYSVFTQYDREYYLARREAFLHKYLCFYAVSKTIQPRSIIELGVSAGSGADAYLSASPHAQYLGIDLFPKEADTQTGVTWDPYAYARRLLTERRFDRWTLLRADLRRLGRLPGTADLVVVDGAHDVDAEYSDLRLALTANPTFIFVDDAGDERHAKPAIRRLLETDLAGRLAYTVPIDYTDGGLVIRVLSRPARNRHALRFDDKLQSHPPGVADGGLDAVHRAHNLIEGGIDLTGGGSLGPFGRLAQRAVLFLLRPYDRHQREIYRAMLGAMSDLRQTRVR